MARQKHRSYTFLGRFNYYVPGIADLFLLLAWFIAGSLLGNLVSFFILRIPTIPIEARTEYSMLIAYPLMFIPAMMYASVKSRKNAYTRTGVEMDSNSYSPLGAPLCIILAITGTLALGFCIEPLTNLLPPMPDFLKQLMESMTTGTLWINFLLVSVFAPVCEEWLCRGMVLRGLLHNKVRPQWAIVISAAFFALIHLNPWQAIPAFALGCLFGYVYYKTGSLKLTMLMHFTNNTLALAASKVPAWENVEGWKDIMPATPYWVMVAACVIISILTIKNFTRIKTEDPEGGCRKLPSLFEL